MNPGANLESGSLRPPAYPPRTNGLELRRTFGGLDYVHFADDSHVYASGQNRIYRKHHEDSDFVLFAELPLPRATDRILLGTKLTRRVFRQRIENVVVLPSGTVVAAYRGRIFRIAKGRAPQVVFDLARCRGTLHRGIALTPQGDLYLGEYVSNPDRGSVRVIRGREDGSAWAVCHESPPHKFRHYHGCFWDPFEQGLWFTTGDEEGENFIGRAGVSFDDVAYIGDGSKAYSAVNLLFTESHVYFANDNPAGSNQIRRLHRSSLRVDTIANLNGPAWYGYMTSDGCMLFASTVEPCPSLVDKKAHLYVSRDGESWQDVFQWAKDPWVPWNVFQFGVINFPGGVPTSSENLWFSGQALRGLDLTVASAGLTGHVVRQ